MAAGVTGDENSDEVRREKQGYLLELQRLLTRNKNLRLSRTFTMADPLSDIRFEFETQTSNLEQSSYVSFMADATKIVFSLLETLNNKLGPLLPIKGWAQKTTEDMTRFERCLEKIYKRYFRRRSMSPILEFLWLILGSLGMYAFNEGVLKKSSVNGSNKGTGGTPGAPPAPNSGYGFNPRFTPSRPAPLAQPTPALAPTINNIVPPNAPSTGLETYHMPPLPAANAASPAIAQPTVTSSSPAPVTPVAPTNVSPLPATPPIIAQPPNVDEDDWELTSQSSVGTIIRAPPAASK